MLIAFVEWVARYNLIPIGVLAKVIIGGVLKVNRIDKFVYTEQKQEVGKINCQLSAEQQAASDKIIGNLNRYSVTLLGGETESGKTEVYLSVVAQLIKNDSNLPTISSAAQTLPSQCTDIEVQEGKLISSI